MNKKQTLLGAHVSAAQGLEKSIDRAESINANCMQIFTKSNRQWQAKELSSEQISTFISRKNSSSIQVIVVHAAYLINLGSKNDETVQKSIKALAVELYRCEALQIPYLVLHPGSTRFDDNETSSLKFIAHNIQKALELSKTTNVQLLVETMAGQGSNLGYTFEQLATIISNIQDKERIGVCLDTCHTFVAGYEFHTQKKYEQLWQKFDKTIGMQRLKAIHVNDSKKEHNSRVDRHEHIGEGKIPEKAFELLMKDPKLISVPKILETPKNDNSDDIRNMNRLKSFIK